MSWAVWLAIPVVATVLTAVWTWLRGRPPRRQSTHEAMQEHSRYLDALAETARGTERRAPARLDPPD